MRLVLEGGPEAYGRWLQGFLPELFDPDDTLEPGDSACENGRSTLAVAKLHCSCSTNTGRVLDSTDYHLVHLEGVNFSRAWNLYNILTHLPESLGRRHRRRLFSAADAHLRASREKVRLRPSFPGNPARLFFFLSQNW